MDNKDLLSMAEKINCDYELGITCEIDDFLPNQDNVTNFELTYKENLYTLLIKLNEFDLIEVKRVFSTLLSFIEYSSTFYVREEYKDRIEYEVLSSMKSNKGFRMKVVFSPE